MLGQAGTLLLEKASLLSPGVAPLRGANENLCRRANYRAPTCRQRCMADLMTAFAWTNAELPHLFRENTPAFVSASTQTAGRPLSAFFIPVVQA